MIIYCSLLQAALQTLYSLILFFLVVRGVYMLRPFRFLWRVGRIMSSAACSLLACMVSPHTKYHINHRKHHPASRLFLLLARSCRARERLCLNRVKPLLTMRCMLLGDTFEPRPNGPVLSIYSRFSCNHRFIKK